MNIYIKLSLKDFVLPDPFHIKDGWIEEEKGVTSWTMVLYPDTYNYLNFNPSELSSADLCDYTARPTAISKEGGLVLYNTIRSSQTVTTVFLKQTADPQKDCLILLTSYGSV